MLLVEDDELVQAFSAQGPDHLFGHRIRTGGSPPAWRWHRYRTDPSGTRAEVAAVDRVAISPWMAWLIPAAVTAADLGSSEVERSVVQFGSQLWPGG
jgi:hypothetical protein